MNILEKITERTRERIEEEKKIVPLEEVRRQAEEKGIKDQIPVFEQALRADRLSFICEAKKASPSKGLIAPDFPYLAIAKEYEQAGASAISCLTEPFYFQGADQYLREIAATVQIPVLRKDFTVDEYMIYQAKSLGASAVLLICAILDDGELRAYRQLAKELGIHCYENRILTLASQLSGLDENVFQEVNEKLREEGGFTSFLRGLPRAKGYISRNEKFKSDDRLFEYQSQIINELADKESCVIVGKCADYVLKNRPNVVSIYIEAPRAFCVERTIANMGVTPEVANATIERTDKFRADYYKYYTHGNYWTNPVNYDLTLNSERVGVENCVKTIEQYLIIKGFIKADMIKPVGELI